MGMGKIDLWWNKDKEEGEKSASTTIIEAKYTTITEKLQFFFVDVI